MASFRKAVNGEPKSAITTVGNGVCIIYSFENLGGVSFFPIITARKRSLGQGNIFRSVCQSYCSQGGACMAGDMYGGGSVHGEGACMGVCMHGGVHGGCVCGRGHACRRDGH